MRISGNKYYTAVAVLTLLKYDGAMTTRRLLSFTGNQPTLADRVRSGWISCGLFPKNLSNSR